MNKAAVLLRRFFGIRSELEELKAQNAAIWRELVAIRAELAGKANTRRKGGER